MRAGRTGALLAGLVMLAGCADRPHAPVQPAFYADLAQPGAQLDLASATDLINGYRAREGLPPLAYDAALGAIAEEEAGRRARSGEIAGSAGRLDGALRAAGIPPDLVRRSISGGYHSFADAFSGWRGAPHHDAILRWREARRFGLAVVARPGSRHRVYWVLLVSR